jgi:RHH-type transcriptional regulator, proline utilization regulon repressor / proline dehydrogenase / delta 1-pyrroline-5-carboxylate dehydrogenase
MLERKTQDIVAESIHRASGWLERANRALTDEGRKRQAQFGRLLGNAEDKIILVKLIDQCLRSRNPTRVADQIHYLLSTYGTPDFFSEQQKTLLFVFRNIGRHLPSVSIPRFIATIRENSRHLILPAETDALHAHLKRRRSEGVRININLIGEDVLGESEAQRRLDGYIALLKDPLVEHVSVKISTLCSQIHPLALEHDCTVLVRRLSQLYDAAGGHVFMRADGTAAVKMVHLDMEAYRDLALTVEAFKRTLDQEVFKTLSAGIVLQAYLPESYAIQRDLTAWAQRRLAKGGAPIRLRIVKGANMEMEKIEAALNGWPLAPFDNKLDVDANYKRMLHFGMQPRCIQAVHLGIASHNLFELAYARLLAESSGAAENVSFEMLEGMADHVRRALAEEGLPLLLYAPVVRDQDFIHAIAYLIRRLDENSGPDNFLRYAPTLSTASDAWRRLADDFSAACGRIQKLPERSHRTQDRMTDATAPDGRLPAQIGFRNEPNTDWSLSSNRQWAEQIRTAWEKAPGHEPIRIHPVVAGHPVDTTPGPSRDIFDLNRLPEKVRLACCRMALPDEIERAVAVASQDPDGWRSCSSTHRRTVLAGVAEGLRRTRGDLIGAAAAETGKTFAEADPEVSEAIDFAELYPRACHAFEQRSHLRMTGKGVGVVISPWNFPIAIPCGGLLAALSAGNTVIFKPATEAVLTAWQLCQVFWEAGVSRNTMQFLPCEGPTAGRHLIGHPAVDFVILTGGTRTARTILQQRPDLFLAAETGGKNSIVVTAMADREQAIKHIIQSAFGHCGQKCSAASLLILEEEVFRDSSFRRALVDAAKSLSVGPAWDFHHRLGPLIHPPDEALLRGLTRLEPLETWALEPVHDEAHPSLWMPGIKWNVQPGSFTHMTELFGPLLGVMRADDLEEAVILANQTGYGLTAGLESLDPREISYWRNHIQAGNLYINRETTGAVTLRQPFGGWRKSAVGPSIKAGGPDYVTQFMNFSETAAPEPMTVLREHPLLDLAQRWERKCRWGQMGALEPELLRIIYAIRSYLYWAQSYFETQHDFFHLRGQDNLLRYRPLGRMAICIHPDDSLFDIASRVAAARIAGCRIVLHRPEQLASHIETFLDGPEGRLLLNQVSLAGPIEVDNGGLISQADRLRYAAADRVPKSVYAAAAAAGVYIARDSVMMDGRIELLHYYLSQSISHAYHRLGNLGERALRRT